MAVVGRSRGRRGRLRRIPAPELDCLEEEEEESTVVLLPQLDLLREAPINGGERQRLGQVLAMASFRFRVPAAGEKGGGEGEQVEGVLLNLHGCEGARGCIGDEGRRSVATAMAATA